MSALIILVNADPRALRHTEAMLSEEGYLVAALTSFIVAKTLLDSVTPDLLIADIRLEEYNGLQLALRSHFDHPDVPVIVTHTGDDAIAEAEAKHWGADFIARPLENPRFLPCVQAAILERRRNQLPVRRWFRKPVAGVVEVNAADVRAQILDMSYGGVRLAFADPHEIPATFEIALPAGVIVKAHCVWTARSKTEDRFCCGAELMEAAEDTWRQFVDSVRDAAAM